MYKKRRAVFRVFQTVLLNQIKMFLFLIIILLFSENNEVLWLNFKTYTYMKNTQFLVYLNIYRAKGIKIEILKL